VCGDLGFARGIYEEILTPRGEGETRGRSGNFMIASHRRPDGSWRAVSMIWTILN
jgi:hypothetical protein